MFQFVVREVLRLMVAWFASVNKKVEPWIGSLLAGAKGHVMGGVIRRVVAVFADALAKA